MAFLVKSMELFFYSLMAKTVESCIKSTRPAKRSLDIIRENSKDVKLTTSCQNYSQYTMIVFLKTTSKQTGHA